MTVQQYTIILGSIVDFICGLLEFFVQTIAILLVLLDGLDRRIKTSPQIYIFVLEDSDLFIKLLYC